MFTAMRGGKAELGRPSAVWVMGTKVSHGLMMAGQVHRSRQSKVRSDVSQAPEQQDLQPGTA